MDESEAITKGTEGLRRFFAPDKVVYFTSPYILLSTSDGAKVTSEPLLTAEAICERLDDVLSPAGWSEESIQGNGHIRSILRVRFTTDGDWISRSGASPLATDCKGYEVIPAYNEALRNAARKFGVGRYLTAYIQQVEVKAHRYAMAPKLPVFALPDEYRPCGREKGLAIRSILDRAIEECRKLKRNPDPKTAAVLIAAKYGYLPDSPDENFDFTRVENRHQAAILQDAHAWLTEAIAGKADGPACPYMWGKAPGQKKSEEKFVPLNSPQVLVEQGKATTPVNHGKK